MNSLMRWLGLGRVEKIKPQPTPHVVTQHKEICRCHKSYEDLYISPEAMRDIRNWNENISKEEK